MNKARKAADAVGQLLEAVFEWEDASDRFIATGSDEDDVVVTHDSRGRMIECSPRPGLQQELTRDELQDAINDAIVGNVARAQAGLEEISARFRERCAEIGAAFGQHPVGEQMAAALAGSP